MPLNPFGGFQRNRKLWMAGVLLLCMITFIFCTGGGNEENYLMRLLRFRAPGIASVNGHSISREELFQLRDRRNAINEFMRKCADAATASVNEEYKKESAKTVNEKDQKDKQAHGAALARLTGIKTILRDRLTKPRYFDLGNKFDDLIEFKLWQAQADRLGVTLLETDVKRMFEEEFLYKLHPQQTDEILRDVRRANLSDAAFLQSLREEFRVRIARLATIEAKPYGYFARRGREPDLKLSHRDLPVQIRAPITPAQFWDYYKGQRAEYDITLVPVHVEDFVKDVPAPTLAQQEAYFAKNKTLRYDPVNDSTGLEIPAKVKVEYVIADPTSPAYLQTAHAVTGLQALSPVLASPLGSPLLTAVSYAANGEAQRATLAKAYEAASAPIYLTTPYTEADFTTPMAFWLALRHPEAAASLVGGLAASMPVDAFAGFTAWGPAKDANVLEAGIAAEVKRRGPAYRATAAAALSGQPLFAIATMSELLAPAGSFRASRPTLPLPIVARDIQKMLDRNMAEEWAHANIQTVRDELEKATGKPAAFNRALDKYVKTFHLTHGKTTQFDTRYTLAKNKTLEPLEAQYRKYYDRINWVEGRDASPEHKLHEEDFSKMFFGTEPFSAMIKYKALAWPPEAMPKTDQMRPESPFNPSTVDPQFMQEMQQLTAAQDPTRPLNKIDLFAKAEKPTLYWRIEEQASEYPETLAQVRERVVEGWKMEEARATKALPKVKEIAEELAKAKDIPAQLPQEALKARRELITLRDFSALHPAIPGTRPDYFAYPLPKEKLVAPRDEMLQDLLQLESLQRPLEYEAASDAKRDRYKDINDLNKTLFNLAKKEKNPAGKFVQVIPNRSRSVYYVAVVSRPPLGSEFSRQITFQRFLGALARAPLNEFGNSDTLMSRAQEQEGRRLYTEMIAQLKTDFSYSATEGEDRKAFDNEGS